MNAEELEELVEEAAAEHDRGVRQAARSEDADASEEIERPPAATRMVVREE